MNITISPLLVARYLLSAFHLMKRCEGRLANQQDQDKGNRT